jgi:hypothetical protein
MRNWFFITRKMLLVVFICCITVITADGQGLHINEIVSQNNVTLDDTDSDYSDFIEIYNSGSNDLQLEGYYLSDDSMDVEKWVFPNFVIPGNSFVIIWASDKDTVYFGNELHTNFKLSSSGDFLVLTSPSNVTVDSVSIPGLGPDASLGRQPDGFGPWYTFETPSPSASNNDGVVTLDVPIFSLASGFYSDSLSLELSAQGLYDTILYTLDGSEPSLDNIDGFEYSIKQDYNSGNLETRSYRTYIYDGPLSIHDRSLDTNKLANIRPALAWWDQPDDNIRKATVVKAMGYSGNSNTSETVTSSYFVFPNGESQYSLPVVSLSLNEDYLFDFNNGIHVPGAIYDSSQSELHTNYNQTGMEWERQGHI